MLKEPDHRITKAEAVYDGPDKGPFECRRCEHFGGTDEKPGPCEVVIGIVQPQGCCCYWELRPDLAKRPLTKQRK